MIKSALLDRSYLRVIGGLAKFGPPILRITFFELNKYPNDINVYRVLQKPC